MTAAPAGAVALVAGGTGPIGRAVTLALARGGYRVAGLSRSGTPVEGAELAVACDVTVHGEIDTAVAAVHAALGPIEVLVNAAHPKPGPPTAVAEVDPDELAAQLAAVQAHAALCARVVPDMRTLGRGRVVYIAGALMTRPVPGRGGYGAAKAAACVLTRYLALEEGRAGITANIVAPGRVVDPADPPSLTVEQAELVRTLRDRLTLPDFPQPSDVADAVTMLVDLPAVTGQTIWVTGGEIIPG
jgi:NAD(P)-dependent dehydrogenase (short-subunit alcohol dehydrogenase family)